MRNRNLSRHTALEENVDKARAVGFYQLSAEVKSAFATLKVVPPNKVSNTLCEAFNLHKIALGCFSKPVKIMQSYLLNFKKNKYWLPNSHTCIK